MGAIVCAACMFLLIGVTPLRPAWAGGGYDDSDADGVPNGSDICPSTHYYDAVARTGPYPGCSVWEICTCGGPLGTNEHWKNRGEYMKCIAQTSKDFEEQGLLDHCERAGMISWAARMGCAVDG
jgi:hypothetical protein